MIKNKKTIALLIALLMLMSNFMGLLGNISIAVQENVTVEFSVENDSSAHLSDDGKTLNYECEDNSSYGFQLGQFVNDEFVPISLTKNNDPEHGDKYVATGITSNKNLKIYCSNYNGGVINVFYGGHTINMFPQDTVNQQYFYSFQLEQIDDVNNYQFRIQETHNSGGEGNGQNLSDVDFTIDFGEASWLIGNTTVTATIKGNLITNNPVNLKGNTEIALSNYNPETMDVRITQQGVDNPFGTTLRVDKNGVTRIMDHNAGHLPEGPFTFVVEEHHEPGGEGNPQIDIPNTEFLVDFGEASWEVRNKRTEASITIDGEELNITNGPVNIRGNQEIKLSNWDSKLMQAMIYIADPNMPDDGGNRIRLRVNVDENGNATTSIANIERDNIFYDPETFHLEFYVERYEGERPEDNLPEANTTANLSISGGDVGQASYINARIAINGYGIWLDDPNQNPDLANEVPETITINDFGYFYDANENNGKVKISFGAIFLYKYVGKVTVNGIDYVIYDENRNPEENLIDYNNRTDWLNHYSGQMVGFDIDVPKADSYDIVVDLDDMEGYNIAIGNFLWTDSEENFDKDDYVGNATLELQQVVYEIDLNCDGDYEDEGEIVTVNVDNNGNFEDPHGYIEYFPYGEVGSLVVPEGAECKMKISPDYGYQVLTFGSNDNPIVTGEVSEFTFIAHKGNFHLSAHVVPVEDVVNSTTDKVKSGTVEIGQNEINSGTVVLSVDDANPTDAKKEGFEEAAGDYNIDSYLDISLDQVIYKGTADDVWSKSMHELNEKATIELELKEDLDNKNIIVIHNVGNGDEFEVIEIEGYDAETKTVKFKADSFSGYAIAVKDNAVTPEEPENPVDPNNPENPQNPVDPDNPTDPQNPEEPENPVDPEEPAVNQEKYTIKEGDFTVVFSDDEGHEFELTVIELMHLTPEELEQMDITEEEYEQAKQEITEALKEYGTILNVYEISIDDEDNNYSHFGETTIRIKMTSEMEKYNTFKLICIDNEDIKDEDIVPLEVKDGELVGNLFHLSNYALVAKNIETQQEGSGETGDTPEEENLKDAADNPTTGDNIMFYVAMFIVSLIGTTVIVKSKK